MSVYKPCDIRGPVRELSTKLYRSWGTSIGTQVAPGATVLIGGDVRTTTPGFQDALAEGLRAAGARVVDLGTLPTPMIYFARRIYNAPACAVVTASHNPPDINGLKWMVGDLPPTVEDCQRLRREAQAEENHHDSHREEAHPATDSATADSATAGAATQPRQSGSRVTADVTESYIEWLEETFVDKPETPDRCSQAAAAPTVELRIVLDPGNGCWSGLALECFRRVFPAARTSAIHDAADGTFPGRSPDCSRPEYLERLRKAVTGENADIGIAFDGDGDRVGFVDDRGVVLSAEEATSILLTSFGPSIRGSAVVYDIKFSDVIARTIRQLGAVPLCERSGHAFIRTRMLRSAARFGAEVSGHYFYGDLEGGDDGLYSAMRMVGHLARSARPLSALRADCPAVFVTPDFRLSADEKTRREVMNAARKAFEDLPRIELDGIRIDFPEGWALLRSSVTEPALTVRFEGSSAEALDKVVGTFCRRLGKIGDRLLQKYRA